MEKKNFIFGIALTDNFEVEDYADFMKRENDLEVDKIKKLKPAYLFRLSDNVRFWQFDADIILWDGEAENYYHVGDFEPIKSVANDKIIAVVDEDNECETI